MQKKSYFLAIVSIIPVRGTAKDQAEIVTQLLFGELGEVLEEKNTWIKVKSAHDGYVGWIDKKQVKIITKNSYDDLLLNNSRQTDFLKTIKTSFGPVKTVKSSYLPKNKTTVIDGDFKIEILDAPSLRIKNSVGQVALEYINAPYLWGGRTTFGIDCSGFTQAVLREFNVEIMRDASQQVKQGTAVDFKSKKIGDLAFFENATGKITHVGIVLENNKIIHASGRVKIEKLTTTGIFSEELNKETHTLNCIKRYLS